MFDYYIIKQVYRTEASYKCHIVDEGLEVQG